MIPRLFEANEAVKENAFQTNGLGGLGDAIECTVIEERNGEYELELTYPVDGIHFSDIENDRLILAKPNETSSEQIFRIYKIEKPINGQCTINAEHISYLMTKAVCLPFEATGAAGAFEHIANNVLWQQENANFPSFPFTFWTDNNSTGEIKIEDPKTVRNILGGEEGSVLDAVKGDYEFDNFLVKLHQDRGSDTGITLRYGKNITDINATDDISEVYTGILPYWKGSVQAEDGEVGDDDLDTVEETVYLDSQTLWSEYTDNFAYPMAKIVDFSSEFEWEDSEGESVTPTRDQVKEALQEAAEKYIADNTGWEPASNVEVSFIHLWGTEEYKDVAALERVKLCDKVIVKYPKLGIDVKMKVIKTDYNVLLNRYNSIELGEAESNLDHSGNTESSSVRNDNLKAEISSDMKKAINHANELITGGLGGYVVLNRNGSGKPNEILIMDTPNKNTATSVIRMNKNGIAFGDSYNDVGRTAWTIDGHFNADYITAGTITAVKMQTSSPYQEGMGGHGIGYNLLLDSAYNYGQTMSSYDLASFDFSESLVEGETYTVSMKVNVSEERLSVAVYHSGGTVNIMPFTEVNDDGLYKYTFTATAEMAAFTKTKSSSTSTTGHGFAKVYASNKVGAKGSATITGTGNVDWIKIETGEYATEWVPNEAEGTANKRLVITDGDAAIFGYEGNTLKSVIDMLSADGGTILLDSTNYITLRTPQLRVSTTSYGDSDSTATATLTSGNTSFVTDVSKYYANEHVDYADYKSLPQEMYVSGTTEQGASVSVYCTLPALLKISYGGRTINGLMVSNTTAWTKAIG